MYVYVLYSCTIPNVGWINFPNFVLWINDLYKGLYIKAYNYLFGLCFYSTSRPQPSGRILLKAISAIQGNSKSNRGKSDKKEESKQQQQEQQQQQQSGIHWNHYNIDKYQISIFVWVPIRKSRAYVGCEKVGYNFVLISVCVWVQQLADIWLHKHIEHSVVWYCTIRKLLRDICILLGLIVLPFSLLKGINFMSGFTTFFY